MRFFNEHTDFGFGKYKGMSMSDVFIQDRSYIEWCLLNLEPFAISNEVLDRLYAAYPGSEISAEAEEARQEKLEVFENEQAYEEEEEYDDWSDRRDPMDDYGRSGEKYGWYNGWSDDVIDDAFDGDPEATWNVD